MNGEGESEGGVRLANIYRERKREGKGREQSTAGNLKKTEKIDTRKCSVLKQRMS
jgi:hypothetical protein